MAKLSKKLQALVEAGKAATQPSPEPPPQDLIHKDLNVYQIFRDVNGVCYLRVAVGPKKGEAQFIVNKGFSVELVRIPSRTMSGAGLNLEAVEGSSIFEVAKRLMHPLNEQVTISQQAKEILSQLLNNKEIETMATAKKAKFASVTAPAAKAAAQKSAGGKKGGFAPRAPQTITFKKAAKEGELPKQATVILEVLQKKGPKLMSDKLFAALEGQIETTQPVKVIWAFYRKRLIDGGYLTVADAA